MDSRVDGVAALLCVYSASAGAACSQAVNYTVSSRRRARERRSMESSHRSVQPAFWRYV